MRFLTLILICLLAVLAFGIRDEDEFLAGLGIGGAAGIEVGGFSAGVAGGVSAEGSAGGAIGFAFAEEEESEE